MSLIIKNDNHEIEIFVSSGGESLDHFTNINQLIVKHKLTD